MPHSPTVAAARARVASGFYDDPAVMAVAIDRLLASLTPPKRVIVPTALQTYRAHRAAMAGEPQVDRPDDESKDDDVLVWDNDHDGMS